VAREISSIEKRHPEGLSSKQILEAMEELGSPLTEATLRKYVQLGLLPRSRRVGEKGKHRGSHGIYPVEVIRRVHEIRRAMDGGETLEQLAAQHAVRAHVTSARVAMEEALDAAEADLDKRPIDKKQKTAAKTKLAKLRKEAKDWVRVLEKWSSELGMNSTRR
jgi:DNA-binding transcriptional MerR regulator